MRTLTSVLFIIWLLLSPSLAAGPCTEINTPDKERVHFDTPGYVPVRLVVVAPVPEGKVAAAIARKAFVEFWIEGGYPQIRRDVESNLDRIDHCIFETKTKRTEKMYLRARLEVVWGWMTEKSYFLHTIIMLPKELVAREPRAGSEAPSGETLYGVWRQEKYTDHYPRRGKKKGRSEERTLARLLIAPE